MFASVNRIKLTPLEDSVVRLALYEGMTNEEIAVKLDRTYSSVANAFHRVIRRLGAPTYRQAIYALVVQLNGRSSRRRTNR